MSSSPSGAAARTRGLRSRGLELGGALLAYLAVSLVHWRSAPGLWRHHIAPDPYDPLFNLYVLDWMKRQLRLGLPDPWGAPFFHPLDEPILLSDHLLGLAAQSLALERLAGLDSIAAYNLLVFLAFPLSGVAAAAVGRAAGLSRLGAFVAGAVYAFAPYHWSQLSHLQVLTYQWVPPTLWFFDRLLVAPRPRNAVAFLAAYLLLVGGGNYLAFMVHVPLLALLLHRGLSPPGWSGLLARRSLRVLAPAGIAAAAATTALFLPYALAADRLGLTWRAANLRTFGATLPSLLTPSLFNHHFAPLAPLLRALGPAYEGDGWFAEKSLFLGVVPLVLVVLGLRGLLRRRPGVGRPRAALAAGAALLFLVVAADLFTLGWWPDGAPGVPSRPGLVYTLLGLPLLAIVALGAWRLRSARQVPPSEPTAGEGWQRGLLLAGGVSLLLCFPVAFEPLSHVVPGFASMRVPTRFFPFALLALAHLAGRGAEAAVAAIRPPPAARLVGGALAALLLVELAPLPIPWHPVPRTRPPAVVEWLRRADDVDAVLHLPLAQAPAGEIARMDLATVHGKPLVNGYSGHPSPQWLELRRICCWPVPDERALAVLRDWEVSHLVVERRWQRRWQRRAARQWRAAVERGEVPGVELAWEDPAGGVAVFRIDAVAPAAAADSADGRG